MFDRQRNWFRKQPIRNKLFISYATAFTLLLLAGGMATEIWVHRSMEHSIESELKTSTVSILNLLETALNGSIHNYLRGVADQDLATVADLYDRSQRGEISPDGARTLAVQILLSQTIGKTGYVCVLDSGGTMRVHPNPEMVDMPLSQYAFVREISARRQGYLEYVWQNPGENATRPKAMYMTYFQPWDWIILATSYRDEFRDLVQLQDLRESIFSLRFGPSGYSYIMDLQGNIVLHPHLEGRNISHLPDQPTDFIDEMIRRRSGKITYFWKNPDEKHPREKMVLFNTLPEFGWIVASASYLDEVYAPLHRVRTAFLFFVGGSLGLLLVFTYPISATITKPLQQLMARVAAEPHSVNELTGDEARRLARCFDAYITRLDSEIAERRQAQKALARSEEIFRKAFRASPHGLCLLGLENGQILHANAPFIRLIGGEEGDRNPVIPTELGLAPGSTVGRPLWQALQRGEPLSPRDVAFRTHTGEAKVVQFSAEVVEIWDERCVLATLEDVTERRRLEREVVGTGDRERARIGQELHDDLAPHLIGIDALTKLLADKLTPGSAEADSLIKIRQWIADAVTKVRVLSRGLCTVHLAGNELELTLREMADDISSIHGLPCHVEARGQLPSLHDSSASQLAYIAREALHNAVKHAKAKNLSIEIEAMGAGLRLVIADDGVGFDPTSPATGMGLRIQRYRAAMVGANLLVDSSPGSGTRVTVTMTADEEP